MTGLAWKPTRFSRFVEAFPSSTFPARIITDAGPAILKAINNPMGPHALVRDWVSTSLARWFGLPTFDFAVLTLDALDEIPLHDGRIAGPGPTFCVRSVSGGVWGGDEKQLQLLDNPEAISRLVVFDTWTRNPDRHPPAGSTRGIHYDNVFLSGEGAQPGRFKLVAMDHTECFVTGGQALTSRIANIDHVRDEGIYGLFPAFKKYVERADLRSAISRMGELKKQELEVMMAGIPVEWEISTAVHDALIQLILNRAAFLGQTLLEPIWNEAHPGVLPFD